MAAYRPDVTRISRYEWDISELQGKNAIFEVKKLERADANTLLRYGEKYIKDGDL